MKYLEFDGSYGEGGGQILRTAVSFSALTGIPVRIYNIRVKRPNPGLARQHIISVEAVARLCGAEVKGLRPSSLEIEFRPGTIKGGNFHFRVGTAGSITLILQAFLLPALFSKESSLILIEGGTDVRWSPPFDYFKEVFLPMIRKMGAEVKANLLKRGVFPKGGGKATIEVKPIGRLSPLEIRDKGVLKGIRGKVFTINQKPRFCEEIIEGVKENLRDFGEMVKLDYKEEDGYGEGGAVVLWAEFEHTFLGASSLWEKGKEAYEIGRMAAKDLKEEIASEEMVDQYMADQILPFLALAHHKLFELRKKRTLHTETNSWIISHFLQELPAS